MDCSVSGAFTEADSHLGDGEGMRDLAVTEPFGCAGTSIGSHEALAVIAHHVSHPSGTGSDSSDSTRKCGEQTKGDKAFESALATSEGASRGTLTVGVVEVQSAKLVAGEGPERRDVADDGKLAVAEHGRVRCWSPGLHAVLRQC
jgi:hypothetical protein